MSGRTRKKAAVTRQTPTRNARRRLVLWVVGLVAAGGAGVGYVIRTQNADSVYVMVGALVIIAISLAGFLFDTSRLLGTRLTDRLLYGKMPSGVNKKSSQSNPQQRLMTAFGFDADELDANRHGYMAKSQRRRLYHRRWEYVRSYGVLVVISLALYVAIVVDGVQKGNISLAGLVIGTLVVGGFPSVFVFLVEDRRRRIIADLHKGDLESVSGRVQVIQRYATGRRLGKPYLLSSAVEIGGVKFETHLLADDVFVEEDNYRVFYVPRSMGILSVEHLGRSQGSKKRG
jgi:hypothetical protein